MPYSYTSMFDGSNIITKRDLCVLLNLDLAKPNLSFSATEINKAYRTRALRFHPDSQSRYAQPIPEKICNTLMDDIALAKKYMLNGNDNIPGKAFKNNFSSVASTDWADTLISMFKATEETSSIISETVDWMYYFSSSLLILIPLSTYSDGQLNFRYFNTYSGELAAIRPYLKDIDGSAVAVFFVILRDYINNAEEIDTVQLIAQIKKISPKLLDYLIEENMLDDLIRALSEASQELKNTLTDDFINKVQYVTGFWPQLIANMPTWTNIMGVYFISTVFTATSLPNFFNALNVISQVIIMQKGVLPFLLAAIPMLLLSALLLPVSLALQIAIPFTWIIIKAAYQITSNVFFVLLSAMNLLIALIPNSSKSINHEAFSLFEGSFNIIFRLTLNVAIELLDSIIFILCNKSLLSSVHEDMNKLFDAMLDFLRSVAPLTKLLDSISPADQHALVTLDVPGEKPLLQNQDPTKKYGFFPKSASLNSEDIWLNILLHNLASAQEQTAEPESPAYAAAI